MSNLIIDSAKCKGCGLCVAFCPKHILALDENEVNEKGYAPVKMTDIKSCIACAICARMCPDSIITVEKE